MSTDDLIIRTILDRFRVKEGEPPRHSRATLVLDVGLSALAEPLREANFMVIVGDGLDAFDGRRELLSGRVLISETSREYVDDAPVMEFGLIGLDAMPRSASAAPLAGNAAARMISDAFIDFGLGEERGAWLLLLHPEGRHVFRRLS